MLERKTFMRWIRSMFGQVCHLLTVVWNHSPGSLRNMYSAQGLEAWIPQSGASLREPEDPQLSAVKMQTAPIGVNLVEDPPSADAKILWRALKLCGRHTRAVEPTRAAKAQPGYRELISFRIEYDVDGKSHVLPRPPPKGPLPGEPPAGRPWQVDAIRVVAILEPPATPSATEEIVMEVDVAFVDPYGNEPASRLILARSRLYTTADVDDLAKLMT